MPLSLERAHEMMQAQERRLETSSILSKHLSYRDASKPSSHTKSIFSDTSPVGLKLKQLLGNKEFKQKTPRGDFEKE